VRFLRGYAEERLSSGEKGPPPAWLCGVREEPAAARGQLAPVQETAREAEAALAEAEAANLPGLPGTRLG